MSFKIIVFVLLYPTLFSATITPITQYTNAQFNPIDTRYLLNQLSPMNSTNSCLCECSNNALCSMANYVGIKRTCILFLAQMTQGQLQVVPAFWNTTFYYFQNRSVVTLQFSNNTNSTIYAIWNTTAGGNSTPSVSGGSMGTYWPTEPPGAAFDNNVTTQYTNHGSCNYTLYGLICGENTGLYFTVKNGPITLIGFYFITSTQNPERDPMLITIEGSNLNGSALTMGSSWTLIYNGDAGLTDDPGRSTKGTMQSLPIPSTPFASYRLLVTKKRSIHTCVSYAEFVMIDY